VPTAPDLDNTSGGMMNRFTTRDIAEIGIFVGIGLVLNLPIFKIHITPDAGSISFVMIPLFLIALRHNWWKSLIAGAIVYGLPACAIGMHGFQHYPFSYMIPYGSICFISLFKNLIFNKGKLGYLFLTIIILLVTFIRFCSECVGSLIFYSGMSFIAILIYNAPYVFITGAIGLIAMLLLIKPLKIINERYLNN